MRLNLLCLVTYCLSSLLHQTRLNNEIWLQYEPSVAEIKGQLAIYTKYGPPNYGENPDTDEKLKVPFLLLSKPVSVHGDSKNELNSESVRDINEIQLIFRSGSEYKNLTGRRVVVTGTLFHGISGHHYTLVLMNVQKIHELKEIKP
jgi:hypothetical protein